LSDPLGGAGGEGFSPLGEHCLAEAWGVSEVRLRDASWFTERLAGLLKEGGFTVLSGHLERFPGPGAGFTVLFVLSESHASAHTYPEHGYVALDLFSCGARSTRPVMEALLRELEPSSASVEVILRGRAPRP
jgi:S-adenosylmethionine decarboxylase proenzyme